jgi:hypothetical protein
MADSKISDLTETTTLAGTEELVVADGGTSKKVTAQNFVDYAPSSWTPRITNTRYGPRLSGQIGTRTMVQDRMYLIPIIVPEKLTVTRIGINVSTAQPSSTIRLGIYEYGSDGHPEALVVDAGTVDSSSTGEKEITISQSLYGNYLLAAVCDTASVTVRAQNVSYVQGDDIFGFSVASARVYNAWYENSVTGALPDPATTTSRDGNSTPRLHWRVV